MIEPVLSDEGLLEIYDEAGECHKRSEFVALFAVVQQSVLAKLAKMAEKQEPVAIYQYQLASGAWIDQDKSQYDYNVKHGQDAVRVVYTHPAPPDALREALK